MEKEESAVAVTRNGMPTAVILSSGGIYGVPGDFGYPE
jgi:hypothetical protein